MNMITIISRIYHDYFLPSKIDDYEEILLVAKKNGYTFETISSFDELIRTGTLYNSKRMIIRRDVDTKAMRIMWKLYDCELKHGARSTCFFRNKTICLELMHDIELGGGMASYHYEELATFARKKRIKDKQEVINSLPEIRAQFEYNLLSFREKTGLPCTIVASHGDYINVQLGISNTVILEDQQLREKMNILRETYDIEQMKYVTYRIADQTTSNFKAETIEAIERGEPVIYLLTHPRQWGADALANTEANVSRAFRAIRYNGLISKILGNTIMKRF